MKTRFGFVSNSSSSSFVCDITGDSEGGWDYSLRDAGMANCENGHTFIVEYLLEVDGKTWDEFRDEEEAKYEEDENYEGFDEDWVCNYNLPAQFCPICQGKEVSREDYMMYVEKHVLSKEAFLKIVSGYSSYNAFKSTI